MRALMIWLTLSLAKANLFFGKTERCCFTVILKDQTKTNSLISQIPLIKRKNIVTALFMGMKFIGTTKPDILNIPRPTITQKNTTHLIAN